MLSEGSPRRLTWLTPTEMLARGHEQVNFGRISSAAHVVRIALQLPLELEVVVKHQFQRDPKRLAEFDKTARTIGEKLRDSTNHGILGMHLFQSRFINYLDLQEAFQLLSSKFAHEERLIDIRAMVAYEKHLAHFLNIKENQKLFEQFRPAPYPDVWRVVERRNGQIKSSEDIHQRTIGQQAQDFDDIFCPGERQGEIL